MSGIFGIVDTTGSNQKNLLATMGQVMSHRPWYQVDYYCDETQGIGLGRIGIGIFNKATQPIWNADKTVALVMAGELYNRDSFNKNGQSNSDEQIVLNLYMQLGDRFVNRLKGAFVIAIWDRRHDQLLIINDRLGLYPLHYAYYNNKLVFAPEMKGILCDPSFRKELDLTALAEYMHFQHLLGDKTFFEDLKLLPSASLLCYSLQSGCLTVQPYWNFSQIPELPATLTFDEAVEESARLLKMSITGLTEGNHRFGIYLSGGLDSRVILGSIEPGLSPLHTITFGQQGCRDVVYAQQVAAKAGTEHHYFEFPDGNWVKKFAPFHLELTEGFHSWIHSHGISTLSQARSFIDVNLTGFGGDHYDFDDASYLTMVKAPNDTALAIYAFHRLSQKVTWPSMNESEKLFLFSPRIAAQVQHLSYSSFCSEFAKYDHLPFDRRYLYFYIENPSRRLYQYYTIFHKSHFEVRFPFLDYDYFEFVSALPAEFSLHGSLRRAILLKLAGSLADVPYDKDGLPVAGTIARIAAKSIQKSKSFINRHITPIFPERPTLYADYENWLRKELRAWGEEILLGKWTLQRDIFNPEFLSALWERHLSGQELWTIGKIAPIMSYEMMLRRFYD